MKWITTISLKLNNIWIEYSWRILDNIQILNWISLGIGHGYLVLVIDLCVVDQGRLCDCVLDKLFPIWTIFKHIKKLNMSNRHHRYQWSKTLHRHFPKIVSMKWIVERLHQRAKSCSLGFQLLVHSNFFPVESSRSTQLLDKKTSRNKITLGQIGP